MTQDLLVDYGEEYLMKNGVDGASITVALYDDSADSLSDTSDEPDITSEPSNGNYSRQTDTVTVEQNGSGNWEFNNDSQLSFDFSDIDTSGDTVDTAAILIDFNAASDGSQVTHLISNPALGTSHNTADVDFIEFNAGNLGTALD